MNGKGGERGQPQLRSGTQAALPILDRLVTKGEAERLSGQIVRLYRLRGHYKAGPNVNMDVS